MNSSAGNKLRARLGAALRGLRLAANLTQSQLAERIDGMTLKRVSEIERGRVNVSVDTIEKLAGALEVDPASLFRFDVPGASNTQRWDDASLIIAKITEILKEGKRSTLKKLRIILEQVL